MKLDIVFERQSKGYTVYVPAFPGCVSEGDTKEEALTNIAEAIELYCSELSKVKLLKILNSVSLETADVKINV